MKLECEFFVYLVYVPKIKYFGDVLLYTLIYWYAVLNTVYNDSGGFYCVFLNGVKIE